MEYIIWFIKKIIPYLIIGALGATTFCTFANRHRRSVGKKINRCRDVVFILTVMAFLAVLSQTILPKIFILPTGCEIMFPDYGELNLVPFRVFENIKNDFQFGDGYSFYISFIGNILMFIPVGLLVSLFHGRFYKGILFGFLFSFFIETVQYFCGRSTDIDDLILNTVGALSGALIWLCIRGTKFAREACKSE